MTKWEFIKENYIDKGLKIFPVIPNGKTPMIEKWQEDCSCDYFQVLYWYENCPNCNWGLPCSPNNLFVLDLDRHDPKKDGIESYNNIMHKICYDNDIKNVIDNRQKTPSDGRHIIFKSDNDLKNVSNNSNVFENYPGIDIRTDGYIVVEPSIIDNKKYEFVSLGGCMPQEMIPQLKRFILENVKLKYDTKKEPYKKPTNVEVGDRDNQLFSYINNIYYKTRLDYDEILCLALHFNEKVLEEPFSQKTVEYKCKKVFRKDRSKMIFINLGE